MFGAGLNCKSVVYGSGEENNSDFIEINERLFSKSGSENIGLQEDSAPNKLLALLNLTSILTTLLKWYAGYLMTGT
ncbi:MAG: hypothetical protein AAF847_10610 [Bacteroidota bacterium]